MRKMKVMTVVGTRPEIIRLSRTIEKLDRYCDHVLVHTGQNYDYELNQIFFEDLGIRKPDHFLAAAAATGAQTIGNVISSLDALLAEVAPDALLVLGDTNSCTGVIPAKRRKIPTFHMEAGNRCFDQRVPEEINRRIVDHTSDVNLTYSDIAREYLLREGIDPALVIKTGSPMFEVLEHYRPQIDRSNVLGRLGLEENGFFLVSSHREENVDPEASFERLTSILNAIAEQYDLPVVISTHPRTKKHIERRGTAFHRQVRLMKPFGFSDFNRLQIGAKAVLSDSGTISEEAAILNFPALNLREQHERPEAMEEAVAMMVGLDLDRIMQGLAILADQSRGAERMLRLPPDYAMPNVSDKVVRIIHSYTNFVNRVVWKKY